MISAHPDGQSAVVQRLLYAVGNELARHRAVNQGYVADDLNTVDGVFEVQIAVIAIPAFT